jgi:hypothetical protein
VRSLSEALDFSSPQLVAQGAPALDEYLKPRPSAPVGVTTPPLNTELQKGFQEAVAGMKRHGADGNHPKFGALLR